MPSLRCLTHYRCGELIYKKGDVVTDPILIPFLQADAPGSFEVIGVSGEATGPEKVSGVVTRTRVAEPAANKMIGAAQTVKTQIEEIDPATMTVAEIKALSLTRDQWRMVLTLERRGQNRAGVVRFIESKLKEVSHE